MTPLNTDNEMIRAASIAQSPIVRILAQRLAERGTQAQAVRDTLTTIRGHFDDQRYREALTAIDQARAALDWARSIPNHSNADEVNHEKSTN